MFPVADDFAAIAQRLKEIRAEVAKERAITEARRQAEEDRRPAPRNIYEDMDACA